MWSSRSKGSDLAVRSALFRQLSAAMRSRAGQLKERDALTQRLVTLMSERAAALSAAPTEAAHTEAAHTEAAHTGAAHTEPVPSRAPRRAKPSRHRASNPTGESSLLPSAVTQALGLDHEDEQRRRLRGMKTAATLLLGGVGAIWVLSYLVAPASTGSGFVRAAAEAGMVGGLADWFAVTALFRHPMGLPIPHTALIPRKKDELAGNLGRFVSEHFLTPDAVRELVSSEDVVRAAARWLTTDDRAQTIASRAVTVLAATVRSVDGAAAAALALRVAKRYARSHSVSAAIAGPLKHVLAQGTHEPLIDKALLSAADAVEKHADRLAPIIVKVIKSAEQLGFIAKRFMSVARVHKAMSEVPAWLRKASADRDDELRRTINTTLVALAARLWNDGQGDPRLDGALRGLVHDPGTARWLEEQVASWLTILENVLVDPDKAAAHDVAAAVRSFAERVLSDDEVANTIQHHLEEFAALAVAQQGDSLTTLIKNQAKKWPPKKTARVFELAVGRDLQFIRINGTVVGALAGVAIHAASLLLG